MCDQCGWWINHREVCQARAGSLAARPKPRFLLCKPDGTFTPEAVPRIVGGEEWGEITTYTDDTPGSCQGTAMTR